MITEVITESTPMAIGLVVTLVGGFVGGIWKIVSSLTRLDHRLDMMEQSLGSRLDLLEKHPHGALSKARFRAWLAELRASNGPSLVVPKLDDFDEDS